MGYLAELAFELAEHAGAGAGGARCFEEGGLVLDSLEQALELGLVLEQLFLQDQKPFHFLIILRPLHS